jgi:hypothetical protein
MGCTGSMAGACVVLCDDCTLLLLLKGSCACTVCVAPGAVLTGFEALCLPACRLQFVVASKQLLQPNLLWICADETRISDSSCDCCTSGWQHAWDSAGSMVELLTCVTVKL